jgi:hypothetical protein
VAMTRNNQDMQQVIEQDKIESPAVDEALENSVEILSGAEELEQ